MKMVFKLMVAWCFALTTLAQTEPTNGRIAAYKFSDNLSYSTYEVAKKAFHTNTLETLRTIETGVDTFELNTSSNQFANVVLANNTVVKVEQSSEFRVDMFNISLKETNTFPFKVNVENFNMNLALMNGSAYFVVNKKADDQAMLQTPLSNFGLDTGKYWIQVDKKFVIVIILDGTLDVYDNITNKKETIQSGNIVLIRPFELHVGKQADLFVDKTDTSVKKAKPEQLVNLVKDVDDLTKVRDEVIWVSVGGNIVAVKVK